MTGSDREPPTPGPPNHKERRFLGGARFVHVFAFPEGEVRVGATVMIEGPVLRLWDADILPLGETRSSLGARGIRAILASLCSMATADGFERIILSGFRIGGANPGRDTEWSVPCRRRGQSR